MMKFRRSLKSDSSSKHESQKPVQISIPQKDAIAIEPPKKVIKALYDYTAPTDPPHYLSFSAGDFLHVVSRENDPDWYEACNPLLNTRGLVPVKYFNEVGKTVRDSGGSTRSNGATHDSGYAQSTQEAQRQHMPATRMSTQNNAYPEMPMHRASKSISKAGGVYGIVSYDFHAERPDELDAKAGEAIIVIAQSNPEWFVAKPITRLGGPGLIPVSFIEIRDMTTGKRADDPVAAVSQAGIPRVEDWKRMAAEYKNTSIPLGTVTTREQQGTQHMQTGMENMNLNQDLQQPRQPPPQQQAYTNGNGHQRNTSIHRYQQQQEQNLFAPVRASVPRFTFADEKFHFVVECRLSNGTHWDLSRIYEDFYELQINLINAFPEEAGSVFGKQRTLPYMPGPVKFVTDNISEGRRANLDEYLRDLLRMPIHITSSSLVRNFFHPRDGDYEVDPSAVDLDEHARPAAQGHTRQSSVSQNTSPHNVMAQNAYHDMYPPQEQQRNPSATGMHQYNQDQQRNPSPGMHQYSQSQSNNMAYGHQRGQPSMASLQQVPTNTSHARSTSQYTLHSQTANHQTNPPQTQIGNAVGGPPVKVKAWFDRDTCVVIRMPPRGQFSFDELYNKIAERRRLEFKSQPTDESDQLDIEYRDEKDGEYYRLEGDEDLDIAVERNEKLTLAVRAARS